MKTIAHLNTLFHILLRNDKQEIININPPILARPLYLILTHQHHQHQDPQIPKQYQWQRRECSTISFAARALFCIQNSEAMYNYYVVEMEGGSKHLESTLSTTC